MTIKEWLEQHALKETDDIQSTVQETDDIQSTVKETEDTQSTVQETEDTQSTVNVNELLEKIDFLSKRLEEQAEINSNLLRAITPVNTSNDINTSFDVFDRYNKKGGKE